MIQLKIDEEFRNLIPPLTAEEFQQLQENIIKDGCRDALVIWNDTIIDGHNRYRICTENGIEFQTVDKQFDSREEAIEWIIRNQFGRRNLQVYARAELVFRLEGIIKARAKENQIASGEIYGISKKVNLNSEKPIKPINTDKELAQIAGVSADSIWKSRVIKNEGSEELKDKVRKGEVSLSKAFQEVRKPENKEAIFPEAKNCIDCHNEFPLSDFYFIKSTGRYESRCKACSVKAGHKNRLLSGVPSELRNIPDEQLIGSLYDIDNVPEYTIHDLLDEVIGKVNEFNRVIGIIIQNHETLIQSEGDYELIEAELIKVNTKITRR